MAYETNRDKAFKKSGESAKLGGIFHDAANLVDKSKDRGEKYTDFVWWVGTLLKYHDLVMENRMPSPPKMLSKEEWGKGEQASKDANDPRVRD